MHIKTHGTILAERNAIVWHLPRLTGQDRTNHTFRVKLLGCEGGGGGILVAWVPGQTRVAWEGCGCGKAPTPSSHPRGDGL